MKVSTFFEFDGSFPGEKKSRIFNVEYIVKKFIESFEKNAFELNYDDLWNDSGWIIDFSYGNNNFSMSVAKYFDNEPWQVVIDVTSYAGFFGKIFGKKSAPYAEELKKITQVVYGVLSESEFVDNISICLSNDVKLTTDTPDKLKWNSINGL